MKKASINIIYSNVARPWVSNYLEIPPSIQLSSSNLAFRSFRITGHHSELLVMIFKWVSRFAFVIFQIVVSGQNKKKNL